MKSSLLVPGLPPARRALVFGVFALVAVGAAAAVPAQTQIDCAWRGDTLSCEEQERGLLGGGSRAVTIPAGATVRADRVRDGGSMSAVVRTDDGVLFGVPHARRRSVAASLTALAGDRAAPPVSLRYGPGEAWVWGAIGLVLALGLLAAISTRPTRRFRLEEGALLVVTDRLGPLLRTTRRIERAEIDELHVEAFGRGASLLRASLKMRDGATRPLGVAAAGQRELLDALRALLAS